MKAASLIELKKSIQVMDKPQLMDLCLKLAKYKVDNKELLTYIIFESGDEEGFVFGVKSALDDKFEEINYNTSYYTKKGLRKTLRFLDKYLKFSGIKETEVKLRIYFCNLMQENPIDLASSKVLFNIYTRQIEKIKKVISTLHEDLQYDYMQLLKNLEN